MAAVNQFLPEGKSEKPVRSSYTFYCTSEDLIILYEEMDEVLFPEIFENRDLESAVRNNHLDFIGYMAQESDVGRNRVLVVRKKATESYSSDEIKQMYDGKS